jgi:hypothetical protein
MTMRMVPMHGGPLDGNRANREITGNEFVHIRTYYVDDTRREVHVYKSHGHGNAPYRYMGIREKRVTDFPIMLMRRTG